MAAFFIVYSPSGDAPAKVQYETHAAAFSQAHVMAERHPGKKFFVMRSSSRPIINKGEAGAEVAA